MSTVEEALKAREERKKRELQESKINTVDSALEVYKKRKQSNAQSSLPDLVSRINKEIEAAKNVSSPSWGKGSLGTFLESTRESRVNTSKLQREVESYKSYLDEKTYNSLYSAISELNKGYDSYVKNAEVMEHFDSEDSYNKWYEKYKKEEDEKQAVLGAEDFDEYSTLGAGVVNPEWNAAHAPLVIAGWKPFGDGETINNMVTFAEKNKTKAATASGQALRGGGESTYGEIVSLINDHMKDDEKAIYNYYVGKGDTKKANEYLTYITDILRQRQAGLIVEQVDNTVLEAVFSLGAGVQKGFTGLENFINLATGADPEPTSTMQYAHGSMSQNNKGLWKVTNDLAYTTGNMTPSILAGTIAGPMAGPMVGKAVGSFVTTLSSAGNSYASMIEEGYGVDEARKYGAMVGITEGLLSYAFSGISSIGGKVTGNIVSKVVDGIDNGIARFFAEVALNMGSEAIEEATQEVLDPVFKMIATGEDFEGIDWSNVAYSALLGGLSAGMLEGVPRAASDINSNYQTNVQMGGLSNKGAVNAFFKGNENGTKGFKGVAEAYKLGKQNVTNNAKTAVNNALEAAPDNAYAQRMKSRLDNGKNASGYQINRLIESHENALASQDKGKMKSAVESRLTELGETGDVSKLADVIVKAQTGEKLTSSERNILVNSKYGRRVSTELNPQSIESGEYTSKWAESIGTDRINTEAYNRGIAKATVAEPTKVNSVTENATVKENAVEGEIQPVAKAKMLDTEGNEVEVNPQRFATTDAGEMGVEIEGGNVVAASEVDFGDSDIGLIRQAAVDMSSRVGGFSVDTANVFVRGYDAASGQSAGAYIDGWITAYKFGAMKNPPPLSALAANPKTAQLSEEQRKNAYNFGRAFGNEKVVSTVSKNDAKISKSDSKMKKGRVIFDGAKYGKTLNERQRASLKALNFLSKALGKDIYVEKLKEGDSGWYDPATGDIHIDLNAGALGEKLLLFTSAHELTHDIRARLAEKFNILADAVFEEYTKKFGDHVMADLIDAKMEFLKEKGDITENMTEEEAYDLAYEEVICDCLETMLVDSDAIEALSKNIYAKDKTLWQRIKDFFARLVARIKAAYEGVDPDSEEGQRFRDLGEGAERIKKLWVEAIVELSEMESTTGEGNVKHSYSSIAYSFFGDKKVSVKDLENGSYKETEGYKRYVENCLNNMRQTVEGFSEKAALNEIEDSIDGIVRVAVAMKKAGYDILDNHAKRSAVDSKNRLLFSSLEPNSDYFTSSDISTICDKRINFAEIYDEIVRREEALGVPKGKRFFDNVDNYFILHKIMADKGLTQPCRQCYVESMRKNLAPMANAFLKLMQETDPDNKANDQLYQPSGKNKGELKSNNAKLRENLLETIVAEEYDITASDLTVEMLTTEDGLAQLKLQAPLIYEAFNSFYGQSKPKMPKSATPFRFGELTAMLTDNKGKIKKSLIDKIMSTGGFRLQSYSDFQIQNFADVLQVIFEAGTLGLSGHAYTKVPAFLDATKGTNLKRNISIFMYNDGGEWKIDRNDSFPYDLDKIYDIVKSDESGNTSIIAVSQNEVMSSWIMANNLVGYFIPFHKSGMKMGTVRETIVKEGGREIKGYSGIKDHTRQQTEVWASANADHKAYTKVKKGINIYEFWDFDNVDNLSREGLIEKNVRAYIDACNEAGYLPKFREYVMNNSKVLNSVLTYSKQLGFVSQNASVDDISFEYKGYRIPYGYYKCLGDFGMFTPNGEASPIERLSLKDYNFDEAEAFFSDAETIRRNEILQQIANGEERERYRNSGMTTAEIAEEVQSKRNKVVEEVVSGEYKKKKYSHTADQKSSYSNRDSLGNVLSKEQQEFFKDSKARDEDGNLYVLFHGTKVNHRIDEFLTTEAWRTGLWLSTDHATAVAFAGTNDAKLFTKENSATNNGGGGVYELYANLRNPLIVDAQGRRYWEIPRPAAMGEGGVVSGEEINAFALKNDYDGVIIKDVVEGSNRLGTDVVAFYPNQVKYTDNLNPTEGKDIRYSHKADKKASYSDISNRTFSYDELVAKDELVGVVIKNSTQVPLNADGSVDAQNIVAKVRKECQKIQTRSASPTYFLNVPDIDRNVQIVEKSITHGFFDSTKKNKTPSPRDLNNAKVSLALPEILASSIEVNRSYREGNVDIPYSHIMMGTVGIENDAGTIEYYAVRSVIEKRKNLDPILVEAKVLGKLHAVNAKKIDSPNLKVAKNSVARGYDEVYGYSIAQFLEDVKGVFDDTFSSDVYRKLGATRRVNEFSSTLLHQHRNSNGMKPRTLLANALETAVSEDEKNLLQTYKENIDKLNSEQEKLETVMSEIDEIRYKKSLSILGEEMSVKTFESRAKAKAKKLGINAEDVQFKLDRSNKKYTAYAVGHGTILEADKTFRSAEDNAKLNALWDEAKDISNQINTYDRELLRLQAMKPIKDVLQREKAMAYKRATEKAEVRRKESVERVKESAAKTEAKVKLQQLILKTSKWISYPGKDDVKCPDILRKPYADFLKGIDLSSKRLLEGGEPTHNDDRVATAMNNLANAIERITNAQDPNVDTDKVLDSGYLDLPVEFVGKLREMAENISKLMVGGDYVINRMSATDVKQLTKLIRTLNHAIKEMSTLYANLRFANVETLGDNSMSFLEGMGEAKGENAVTDFVAWDNALPYYAFKRFGDGGESIFEGLMDGQDKLARLAKTIFDFKDKTWTDKESKAWGEDTHTIDLPSGNTLTLTTANAMGIYCLSRREQGLQHLLGGGTRVIGIKKGTKKAADSRSTLTQEDINAIVASLTDRQKKVALELQKFMSEVCAEWGNEVSMKRFLTKEFTDPNYYPIESNDENLAAKDPQAQKSDLYRLLNISATKPLAPGANNEIIIRNIFDVFIEHASDMAKLNAYGLPLLDYMKWVNYREKSVNENGQIKVRGVHKAMIRTYGDKSWSYVLNLIKDVNGRFNDNGDNSFLMNMMRMQKTASVGNNLRVAFLQFTSYPRASLVLSNKSLALGLTKKPQMEKAKKYCGIALWKSYGFYDTNIARSIEDQLKGTTDIRQKLIELSMKGPEFADAITWGALWNACEYEVAKTTKNKVGSEEFYQEVGLKLREVVYATQVVDSILTRSQIMRSKSGLTQTATAYMSEPTLTTNIVMDAGFQFQKEKRTSGSAKTAWKKTGKIVIGAVGNYLILQLITSIAESLADAWRDDDEEEFLAKFGEAFGENLITNLIPFNKIPIISDIADLLLSFFGIGFVSSDNLSTSWLTQAANAVKTWSEVLGEEFGDKEDENYKESSKTVYNAIYQTAKVISSLTGVSVSGAMREVVAVWNNTAGAIDPTLKIRQYDLTGEENRKGLYEAIISGDEKEIAWFEAGYEDQSKIDTAIRKALRENDPRIKEAAEARYKGDISGYMKIAKSIIAEGHFKQDDIVAAINSEISAIKKGETPSGDETEDKDEVTSIYSSSDINVAFDSGDTALAKEIIADLIKTKVANGKTEKEAKSSLRSSMTSYWKPIYKKNPSQSEWSRIRKILYYSGLYGNLNDVDDTLKDWLKD